MPNTNSPLKSALKLAIQIAAAAIFLGLVLVLISIPVEAHSIQLTNGEFKYPAGCCSNKDCRPLEDGEARYTPDGWRIATEERTWESVSKFRQSPDRRWHACFYEHGFLKGRIRWSDKRPCIWAPESGL